MVLNVLTAEFMWITEECVCGCCELFWYYMEYGSMDGSERTLTVEYTWKLWSPESVCRTYDIAHRLHDRTTASTAYLSPKDARLFPKPNDGQHPQEQGVKASSCLSLTSIRNLGKRHCSIRKPCYMLHQNDRQPYRAKPDEDPTVTTTKRNQPSE